MASYTFTIPNPGGPPVLVIRAMADEADAILLAKRFAKDWPDAPTIDVTLSDTLLHREFNTPT